MREKYVSHDLKNMYQNIKMITEQILYDLKFSSLKDKYLRCFWQLSSHDPEPRLVSRRGAVVSLGSNLDFCIHAVTCYRLAVHNFLFAIFAWLNDQNVTGENFERGQKKIRAIFFSPLSMQRHYSTVGQRLLKAEPCWAKRRLLSYFVCT